jgi:hypothetical protein
VSSNLLKKLPYGWGELSNLKRLWLSGNLIDYLPIDCNVFLSDFDPITGIRKQLYTKGFGGLHSLEELWLDNNRLKSITSEISNCESLRYLNMRRNLLVDIPSELGDIKSLEFIVLTHNLVQTVPDSLFKLPNLHTLELDCNRLEKISELVVFATALTDLNLSHNPLRCLPAEISLCKNLVHLKTVHSQRVNSECPSGQWNKFRFKVPMVQKDGLTIEYQDMRPKTSSVQLMGESKSRSESGRPCTRAQYTCNSGSAVNMMAVGGFLPSSNVLTYSPPPISTRPPMTPYSCARPNAPSRYSGAYHESANI